MLTFLTKLELHTRDILGRSSRRDEGAGIVEYLLLVVFIALVMIVALAFFTGRLSDGFSRAGNSIPA
jgi:Flp pilus assembly pilin Flp